MLISIFPLSTLVSAVFTKEKGFPGREKSVLRFLMHGDYLEFH